MHRVAIVGARRRRQGTGEYIAREFARCGCDIRAIVGTTEQSIELARAVLRQRYGIHCRGFTSLAALLDAASIDIVAICSPSYAHRAQLDVAAEAGCHVFCEKPLWWDDALTSHTAAADDVRRDAERLLRRFVQQHRYLGLNTQWPFTLEAFRQLHPDAEIDMGSIERFAMWLSPTSRDREMVVDSAPHLLSMLHALAGPGTLDNIRVEYRDLPELGSRAGTRLNFVYTHAHGTTDVEFSLARRLEQPRPAGYSVNGFGAQRHVALPEYLISFVSNGRKVPVRDPLASAVEDFIYAVKTGRNPNKTSVVDGMTQLLQLVAATSEGEPYEKKSSDS